MKTRSHSSSPCSIALSVQLLAAVAIASSASAGADESDGNPAYSRDLLAFFRPLPKVMPSAGNPVTEEKVALGRQLYFDTRLSLDGKMSCNSCHLLDAYGVDNKPTSPGFDGQLGNRNSPTVYNAALHVSQFWDGRAADVEEQAKGPVLNPVEMAMPHSDAVIDVLKSIPGYVEAFATAFPGEEDPVNYDNFGRSIGAFERMLVTPGRFDLLLEGDDAALTAEEKTGLANFVQAGCIACHSGEVLGGKLYQKLGLVHPWPRLEDEGRAAVTGNEAEKFVFKVPGLRNIAKTGPYLHDGSAESLDKVVELMAWHQLGQHIAPATAHSITTFLNALTGDLPTDLIAKPEMPDDGAETAAILAKLRRSAGAGDPPSQ